MSRFGYLVFAFVLAIFSSSSGFAAASGDVRFRTVRLKAGGKIVHAEVAATDAQRERGLMYRKSLPENNGMLFVFDRPAPILHVDEKYGDSSFRGFYRS